MDRVRNHISFVVWFVGLSYIALGLYRTDESVALPPGLHLIGMVAALWIVLLLTWLAVSRIAHMVLRRAVPLPNVPLRVALQRIRAARREAPPRRWVPRRRDFGLRGTPR